MLLKSIKKNYLLSQHIFLLKFYDDWWLYTCKYFLWQNTAKTRVSLFCFLFFSLRSETKRNRNNFASFSRRFSKLINYFFASFRFNYFASFRFTFWSIDFSLCFTSNFLLATSITASTVTGTFRHFNFILCSYSTTASPIPFVATLLYCATSSSVLVSVVATTFVSLFRFANFRFRFASFRFELKWGDTLAKTS